MRRSGQVDGADGWSSGLGWGSVGDADRAAEQ